MDATILSCPSPQLSVEGREQERRPGDGEIRIYLDQPEARTIGGRLVDISDSGFRAAHNYPALTAGTEVCFQHETASGVARVVWNCVTEGKVVSGFFVLDNWPAALSTLRFPEK